MLEPRHQLKRNNFNSFENKFLNTMNEEFTGFSGNLRSSSPLPPEAFARAPENADVLDIEIENITTKQSYMVGGLC